MVYYQNWQKHNFEVQFLVNFYQSKNTCGTHCIILSNQKHLKDDQGQIQSVLRKITIIKFVSKFCRNLIFSTFLNDSHWLIFWENWMDCVVRSVSDLESFLEFLIGMILNESRKEKWFSLSRDEIETSCLEAFSNHIMISYRTGPNVLIEELDQLKPNIDQSSIKA